MVICEARGFWEAEEKCPFPGRRVDGSRVEMRCGRSHEESQEEKGDSDSRSPLLTNTEAGVVASSRFFISQPVPRSGVGNGAEQGNRVRPSGTRACGP